MPAYESYVSTPSFVRKSGEAPEAQYESYGIQRIGLSHKPQKPGHAMELAVQKSSKISDRFLLRNRLPRHTGLASGLGLSTSKGRRTVSRRPGPEGACTRLVASTIKTPPAATGDS